MQNCHAWQKTNKPISLGPCITLLKKNTNQKFEFKKPVYFCVMIFITRIVVKYARKKPYWCMARFNGYTVRVHPQTIA